MKTRSLIKGVALVLGLAVLALGVRHYLRFPPGATVLALVQTTPVPNSGDAGDDAAIWVDPTDPSRSMVIGTDKKGGLATYNLAGEQMQFLPDGNMINVDLQSDFTFGDGSVGTLVAVSEIDLHALCFYRVLPGDAEVPPSIVALPDNKKPVGMPPEGVTLYRSPRDGSLHAFIVGHSPDENEPTYRFRQFEITPTPDGSVSIRQVRESIVGTKSEGCVADDDRMHFYVSEEDIGVWRYDAEPDGGEQRELVSAVGYFSPLRHDVEGLAIHDSPRGRFLIASSQGSDDYTVTRLDDPPKYVGRFRIGDGDSIDGTAHTDGLDVCSTPVGALYPDGLLVIHDGRNTEGGERVHQNYKFISWRAVIDALELDKP